MKEIQLSSIASRSLPSTYPEKLRRIAAEINMIMSINHPNIVRYFGIERYKVKEKISFTKKTKIFFREQFIFVWNIVYQL
jgi:hypothetical protein